MKYQFHYDGAVYETEQSIRDAIWLNEHKVFGSPQSAEEWSLLGVTLEEVAEPAIQIHEPNFEELKLIKRSDLKIAFDSYRVSNETSLVSSLGFKVNANTTALENVNSLVTALNYRKRSEETPVIDFKDFDGCIQALGLEQIELIQFELITNNSHIYSQKWAFEQLINQATCQEDLDAIEFHFYSATF